MTFSISKFKSSMDKFGGPDRGSLFEVQIINFPTNNSKVDARDLTFFCKNVGIPGMNFEMNEYAAVGQKNKSFPSMITTDPIQSIFILDSDQQILSFFHGWAQRIVNYSTQGGRFSEIDGMLPYEVGYKDEYACRIVIKHYSGDFAQSGKYYEVILDNAFPNSIGDVDLSWEANDSYSTLPVSFQYDRIQYSGEVAGSPSNFDGRGNGLLGLINTIGAVGQLIGTNIVPQSITDAVSRFTRIKNTFDNIF